jgi:hypothetical protein
MMPEKGQCPQPPPGGSAVGRRHGAMAHTRVRPPAQALSSAGRGSDPAPAVTADGCAPEWRRLAVTAVTRPRAGRHPAPAAETRVPGPRASIPARPLLLRLSG